MRFSRRPRGCSPRSDGGPSSWAAPRFSGEGDLLASQDFEDIATILDGSTTVWRDLATDTEVAAFVRGWLCSLDRDECEDALAGHVGGYARASLLARRIDALPE